MRPPGRICGPSASRARSTIFSSCRIRSLRPSLARSRRSSSWPRSSARSASRPKASTPTTTICAAWRTSIWDPGSRSTRRSASSTTRSCATRISRRPMRWRRGAIFWRKVNGWMTDRPGEIAEGARLARRAVNLGRDDAVALTRGGHALAHLTDDVAGGIALLDRALVLNPNLASAWFLAGFLRTWNGEPDAAIEHFARAMRLSPLDPELYRMQAGLAAAHLFAGRFDAASSWAEKAFRELPSFLMVVSVIAASHALAGRPGGGERAMKHLRKLDPTLRAPHS